MKRKNFQVQSLLDLAKRHGRTIPADAVDILVENEVDPSSLLILSGDALEEIGIGVVARVVLLDIINKETNIISTSGGEGASAGSPSTTTPSRQNNNNNNSSSPSSSNVVSSAQLDQERAAHIKTCQERAELRGRNDI